MKLKSQSSIFIKQLILPKTGKLHKIYLFLVKIYNFYLKRFKMQQIFNELKKNF